MERTGANKLRVQLQGTDSYWEENIKHAFFLPAHVYSLLMHIYIFQISL